MAKVHNGYILREVTETVTTVKSVFLGIPESKPLKWAVVSSDKETGDEKVIGLFPSHWAANDYASHGTSGGLPKTRVWEVMELVLN